MHVSPPRSMPPPVYAGAFSPAGNQHHQGEAAAVSAANVSKALHIHTLLVFEPEASAPPFSTYTRPQQPAYAVEQRLEEQELSAALAASLKDYHHHQHQQQRHHTQQQQLLQQAAAVPLASARVVEIESVNAVAQVLLGVIFI